MHVKSERGCFVKLERSSTIDCTTNVLGLGSGTFFCNFFFFLVHYQMTTEL